LAKQEALSDRPVGLAMVSLPMLTVSVVFFVLFFAWFMLCAFLVAGPRCSAPVR